MRIVSIKWRETVFDGINHWLHIDEFEKPEFKYREAVGYLVYEDDFMISLAQCRDGDTFKNFICIEQSCVVEIDNIGESDIVVAQAHE